MAQEGIRFEGPLSWRPVRRTSQGWRTRPLSAGEAMFVGEFLKKIREGRIGIIAEGDSWFRNPVVLEVIDHLESLNRYAIDRSEIPGRWIKEMAEQKRYLARLKDKNTKKDIKCMLLSGGGNDLLDKDVLAKRLLQKAPPGSPAEAFFRAASYGGAISEVKQHMADIVKNVLKLKPELPIITHTYAYPIPRNAPALGHPGLKLIQMGPWIYRAAKEVGIHDTADMQKVAIKLIDDFHDLVLAPLAAQFPGNLHVLNLRPLFPLDPSLWNDEIHLSSDSFKVVAGKFAEAIQAHQLA
jgi:hypothetical protein